MRKYTDKKNAQLKNYYEDRFYHAPKTAKLEIKASKFEEDFDKIKAEIKLKNAFIELDFLVLEIEKEDNVKALTLLKSLGYSHFTELSAIDFMSEKNGFEVFYHLLSLDKKLRIRVKTFVGAKERLQSIVSVFRGANWPEREIYDMFGIFIINHPNLKRILMPDDWYSHPLLKSYPLQGDDYAKWYEIDRIFGKEYREIVGEEQRNPGLVKPDDSKNFAKFSRNNLLDYQEQQGVLGVKKLKRSASKTLEKRR